MANCLLLKKMHLPSLLLLLMHLIKQCRLGLTLWALHNDFPLLSSSFSKLARASSPSQCKSVEKHQKMMLHNINSYEKGCRSKNITVDEEGLGCECDIGVDTVLSRVATFAYNL